MNDWQLSTGSIWFIPTETTISTDPDTPIYNQMTAMFAMTGRNSFLAVDVTP